MPNNNFVSVVFTFNGKVPASWRTALCGTDKKASWIDPDSNGSKALQGILANTPVSPEDFSGTESVTVNLPKQADVLSSLVGMYAVADAQLLLVAVLPKYENLSSVNVLKSSRLPSGVVIRTEQKAERCMYFMTQNGICVLADSTINLSPEKLPGVTFFSSEEELDRACLERWGENGGEGWRAQAAVMMGRKVLMSGFGNMIELGDDPEERINSLSN
ncbi:hypothetical protein [Photorhabdus asymbiotica]|uniref:hypothetical protein n=1 Tax=Photorhabdus asymbiotica TaxID=291112 RepID=UPI003DA7A485